MDGDAAWGSEGRVDGVDLPGIGMAALDGELVPFANIESTYEVRKL